MVTQKMLSIYIMVSFVIFMFSCSNFSEPTSYTEWEGWQKLPQSLTLELDASKEIGINEVLDYQIILTNTSDDTLRVKGGKSFSNQLEFDLAVVNKDEELIWTRFPRKSASTSVLHTVTLKPGESYTLDDTWNLTDENQNKILHGRYVLYSGIHGLEISSIKKVDGTIQETNVSNYGAQPVGGQPFILNVVSDK